MLKCYVFLAIATCFPVRMNQFIFLEVLWVNSSFSFYMALLIVMSLLMTGFFQVPRSSKKLYEDNEYALYTVTLFKRVADNFRTSAREKGCQVSLCIWHTAFVFYVVQKENWPHLDLWFNLYSKHLDGDHTSVLVWNRWKSHKTYWFVFSKRVCMTHCICLSCNYKVDLASSSTYVFFSYANILMETTLLLFEIYKYSAI